MTTYYLDTTGMIDVSTKISTLNQKVSIDLQIPNPDSITHNVSENRIEIYYATDINDQEKFYLGQLCQIILYDAMPGVDIFVSNMNHQNRQSYSVSSTPTPNHDCKLGYSVGSIIINSSYQVYVCTDDSIGDAKWQLVNSPSAIFSSNFNKSASTSYYTFSNTVFRSVLSIPFPGTNNIRNPVNISLICSTDNSAVGEYLLINLSNGQVIANGTWSSGTEILPYNLIDTNLSNVPATESILDLSVRKSSGVGKLNIYSFSIN